MNDGYLSLGFASNGKLILPIAEHKDGTWRRVEDISIFESKPLNEWYLYYPSGKQAKIRSGHLVMDVDSHDAYVGFETSFVKERWSPNYGSNANLAFTESVHFVRFSSVDTLAFQYLIDELAIMLERKEDDIISNESSHRYERDGIAYVRGIPVEDSLRAAPKTIIDIKVADKLIQDKRFMYFNAVKRHKWWYPTLRGWIILEDDEYKYVPLPGKELFYMDSFESKVGAYYRFHGAFEWGGRVLIIADISGWDSLNYDLIEFKDDEMRFLVRDSYLDWVYKVYEEND